MTSAEFAQELAPVSVVIPCYRCPDTIERAVISVAAQTRRPAELILVDDASEDETPKVLRELQRHYRGDWIKIILREENGGPGVARNTGWEVATQPYLAFLDADDTWHPRKIEIQLECMQRHPEVIISGHHRAWLQQGDKPFPLPTTYEIKLLRCWEMLLSNQLSTPTVMLRTDLPLRFEPAKSYSEDYLLWLQLLCRGHKGVFINLKLAYLFKAPYGAGGLSGQLWAMEKGQLDTYRRLHAKRVIPWLVFCALSVFSLMKFIRRLAICRLRSVSR